MSGMNPGAWYRFVVGEVEEWIDSESDEESGGAGCPEVTTRKQSKSSIMINNE